MAKAHVEMTFTSGMPDEAWTLEEYEAFMRGTGEWPSENTDAPGKYISLPSGCYFIPEQYTKPDENGAVV